MGFRDEMDITGVKVKLVPGVRLGKKESSAMTEYTEYGAEYSHRGTRWAMNFFAEDDDDAANKVESIRASLRLYGRIVERIKVEEA